MLDENSAHFGVSTKTLMKNAAAGVAEEVVKRFHPKRVLIVCGPGNNGGDGLTVASILSKSAEVRVLLSHAPDDLKTTEARWAYQRLDQGRIAVERHHSQERFREWARDADVVVDALLGSGLSGDLREPIRSLVRLINASRRPVVSVDVPTGYEGRLAVRPDVTVVLHEKKPGMTRANSGVMVVRDIGIPQRAKEQVGPGDFAAHYPSNPAGSHKGQNGRLLVVAGGPYSGAPILCAMAAARSGIDLVHLYVPHAIAPVAQSAQHDLIIHPGVEPRRLVPNDAGRLRPLYSRVDALLMGPGIGDEPQTQAAVRQILADAARAKIRVILDADALVVAGKDPVLARRVRPVVTPHAGEFKEFTGKAVPKDLSAAKRIAMQQASRLRSTILLKGATDIITDGRRVKTNTFHHPAMTTGGTGDVLAGITAAFVAKGMDPFGAACAATFVNGAAGVAVARRQGGTLVASDLVAELPRVFRRYIS